MSRVVAVETFRRPSQPNLLAVRVYGEDGAVGVGDAFYGAQAVEAYLHETAAPALLNLGCAAPERAATALRSYVGFQGAGAETRGNGAIDVALWDLLARRSGLPLSAALGGPVRSRVPVYNTCAGSRYVQDEARQAVGNWGLPTGGAAPAYEDLDAFLHRPAELARELIDEGYRAMKVWPFDTAAESSGGTRIDRAQLRAGLGILDAIRDEAGPEMEILVELHGLWSLPAATRLLRELERFDPLWVEDPLRSDSAAAYGELRRRVNVAIATGETLTGRRAFGALLERGALDVAIVDLGWCGGLTEARKIAALADAYDVPVAPHDCTGPIAFAACVHFVASQPNGLIQEGVRAFQRTWYRTVADGFPAVEDGHVDVPRGPGHGATIADELERDPHVVRRVTGSTP